LRRMESWAGRPSIRPRCGSAVRLVEQFIEGVIWQLKDYFGLERHRAKSLGRLLTRLAAKVAAYTVGQVLNERLGRPLRGFAELLI
jgi:hypothetical protein